jgi:hypothetical protein
VVWLLATATAGVVTSSAVTLAGRDAGLAVDHPMSPREVQEALSRLAPPLATAPEATIGARSKSAARRSSAAVVGSAKTRSWQVPGGSLAAVCRGDRIDMLYASPAGGWNYQLVQKNRATLTVRFAAASATSTLAARCRGGAPIASSSLSTQSTQSRPSGSEADD